MHPLTAPICFTKRIPVQACLKCEVRRASRTPQLITRHPKGTHSLSRQPGRLDNDSKEAPGGGNSTWKCASTQRNTEDFEQPVAGDKNQQLEKGAKHNNLGVQAALGVLWFYKNGISPLLPKSCRFIPTCSSYSVEAYQDFGFWKGSMLTTWRVLRCNPLSKGGFDPPQWPPIGLHWAFGHERIRDR